MLCLQTIERGQDGLNPSSPTLYKYSVKSLLYSVLKVKIFHCGLQTAKMRIFSCVSVTNYIFIWYNYASLHILSSLLITTLIWNNYT